MTAAADGLPVRLFVAGDVHGCRAELAVLLRHLADDRGLTDSDQVVFVGDYIDRGPDSRGVVDELLDFRARFPGTVFLKGNHEDMFLDYLGLGGSHGAHWIRNGGLQCLSSYGAGPETPARDVAYSLPEGHLSFYLGLDRMLLVGGYVIVHAGLNPVLTLGSQTDADLFWIRDEFIMNVHRFGKTVVFGHTPYEDVLFHLPYKLGIDTGLVYGNKLTCVELVGQEILQVERRGRSVVTRPFPKGQRR